MKYLKMLGLAAVAATAFMAFASTASATTLETVGGSTKNETITLQSSLASGTSAQLNNTSGSIQNTCTTSNVHGYTTTWTGTVVTGPLTGHPGAEGANGLTFSNCTRTVTVHDPGTLEIEHIAGTTSGTVNSEEAEVTVGAPLVGYLTCRTGETTHLGTLAAASSDTTHAALSINAVIPCGITATWTANYVVTTPTGLGVSA